MPRRRWPRNIPDSRTNRPAPFLVAPVGLGSSPGHRRMGGHMQKAVRKYLKALEANDVDNAAALFTADGWVQSPFLGRLPLRAYMTKVASASSAGELTVRDVLVSAEGRRRPAAY